MESDKNASLEIYLEKLLCHRVMIVIQDKVITGIKDNFSESRTTCKHLATVVPNSSGFREELIETYTGSSCFQSRLTFLCLNPMIKIVCGTVIVLVFMVVQLWCHT
jgi:hypothetical protein